MLFTLKHFYSDLQIRCLLLPSELTVKVRIDRQLQVCQVHFYSVKYLLTIK